MCRAGRRRDPINVRETGIAIVGDVPWGTHFCQFYKHKGDLIDILVPYFKAGLDSNELCMWITSEPLGLEEARSALARAVGDLEPYIRAGRLEILDYRQWYTAGGTFDSGRVLRGWIERLQAARARGLDGLRLSGNTFWLESADWNDFTDYEAAIDALIKQHPMLACCTYSLARCGAVEIMDVVSNHAFALVRRAGHWQIIQSAERKRIEASLRRNEDAQALLAAIVESSTEAIIGQDLDGSIQSWNAGAERMFSYSGKEVLGRHIAILDPPGARDGFAALARRACGGELIQDYETIGIRKDGTPIHVALTLSPIRGRRGNVAGISCIAREITRRKQAEESLRRHREWLRVTLTCIGDAVLAADTEGRVVFLNPAAEKLTGWMAEEAHGRPVSEVFRIVDERNGDEAPDIVKQALTRREVVLLANHTALIARDGTTIPVEDSAAPIIDSDGNLVGAVLVFHDATEKRRAEEALRQSERRVRLKLESILSPEGDVGNLALEDILDVPAMQSLLEDFYKMAGFPMTIADLQGKVLVAAGWQDVCSRFHREHPEACRRCIESQTDLTVGVPPGTFKLYQCKNNLWYMTTPLMLGGVHKGNLFTGQFFLLDEPIDYDVFRRQAALYGFPEEEYLAAIDSAPRFRRAEVDAGMTFLARLGQLLSILSYSNLKLARALSERDALTTSLKRVQEIAHLGSWELDRASGRLTCSDEMFRIFGIGPKESRCTWDAFLDAVHPDDRAAVDRAYTASLREGNDSFEIDHRIVRPSGEVRWVHGKCEHVRDDSGAAIRTVGMFQDITERKQAEEHLREAQRLESIGLLAGGIAHDFNNLLTGVIGNASLARELVPADSEASELLYGVIRTGEELAHLTRQMLAYSGKGRFLVQPFDLSKLIGEFNVLVQPSIPKKIAIRLHLEADLPAVEADRGQLQQVYMNLVINAAEAIGSAAGMIDVRTGMCDVDEEYQRRHPWAGGLRPGRYVWLEVRDTGCGMDDATRAKAFDPFFSTKFLGRGLGLAAVAGIVRGHKGAIGLESRPGEGTCFTVLFPAAARKTAGAAARTSRSALHGKGTVLVVDDEQFVRELARKTLVRYGYDVLEAPSGPAALDIAKRHPGDIPLVLLDLSMPEMGGDEVLPELRKLRPNAKVVVSSGYSEAEALTLFAGQTVSGFIQKPYTASRLAETLKEILLSS